MKQTLLFFMSFFCITTLYSQRQQNFPCPDIWLKTVKPSNSFLQVQVSKPDTSYSLPVTSAPDMFINYQPVVVWDSTMQPWCIPYRNTAHFGQTAFVVYQCADSINEYGIWSMERDSVWFSSQTTRRLIRSKGNTEYQNRDAGMPLVSTCVQAWSKSRVRDKEIAFMFGQSHTKDSTIIPFSGLFAECLVYGQSPNRLQADKIQTYLALKYGITLIKSNYTSISDSILWDTAKWAKYSFGIAGLGKDTLSGLDQRQSHSTSEPLFMSIAAGHTANNNRENNSLLQQGDYLLWGHDSVELKMEGSGTNLYPYAHPLLQRKWAILPYGNMRSTATEIVIRANELPDSTGPFWLAIDRSGTGNFTSSLTEYFPADSVSPSNEVFFRNIFWDVDSSGSDLFTFAVGSAFLCDAQHPSCANNPDGELKLEIVGGTSPYRYILTHKETAQHQQWNSAQRVQTVSNLAVGNYKIEAYDSENHYWEKDNLSLTAMLPERLGIAGTYHLAQGDTLFLDAATADADSLYSYIWKKGGIVFDSANYVKLTQSGHYELIVNNGRGCTTTENIQVITGAGELFPCEIYPNPTPGPYEVRVTLPEVMDIHIRIYSVTGVFMLDRRASGQQEYSFTGYIYNTGRYIVDVQTPIGRRQLLLIVKR